MPNPTEAAPTLFAGLLRCACGKLAGHSAGKTGCASCGVSVPLSELETVFASNFYELLISTIPELAPTLCDQSDTRAIHLSLADHRHRLTVAKEKRDGFLAIEQSAGNGLKKPTRLWNGRSGIWRRASAALRNSFLPPALDHSRNLAQQSSYPCGPDEK